MYTFSHIKLLHTLPPLTPPPPTTTTTTTTQELDYEKEAANQKIFKSEFEKRKCKVHVPTVFDDFTSRRVLTTEWVNGVKLADAPIQQIRRLIPVGVELFLTQLLDLGVFHADPVRFSLLPFA